MKPKRFLVAALLAVTFLPFAALTAQAADDDLVCGQSKTINATIRDAGGSLVSDHTRVEFVTNFGGVLAGTGATLDPLAAGYIAPLSSTTAETFNGVATVTLLTSTEHIGPYEVVISTGGAVHARQVPQAPIYSPGSTTPNTSAYIPQFRYQTTYVPAGPVISAQITVTCKAP
jgi:hypothetical protein